ncbi:MAG: MBL fold metallo-hydrolase [Candidatus Abyssubacteria bacterium]
MLEIAEGVYCETGWEGANVGAIGSNAGPVLVDSPMLPRDALAWKREIDLAFKDPILFLINTDYHFDHVMTDCLLCERVIAHTLAEPAMAAEDSGVFLDMVSAFFPDIEQESKDEIKALRSVPPCITFSEMLALNLGNRRIEVMHMGGHTPATSVIYLPENGILFTGDNHVHNRHPFPGDANLLEWVDVLKGIERMEVAKIVPGHGEVCDLSSVARLRQYFEEMKERVLELMEQGCGRQEVERRVDMTAYFPIDSGKEERTRSFILLGVGRMYDQLVQSVADRNK